MVGSEKNRQRGDVTNVRNVRVQSGRKLQLLWHRGREHRLPGIRVSSLAVRTVDRPVRCIWETTHYSVLGGRTEVLDSELRVQFRNAECGDNNPRLNTTLKTRLRRRSVRQVGRVRLRGAGVAAPVGCWRSFDL